MTDTDIHRILVGAHNLIAGNGLQHGKLAGPDGYCIEGAVGMAASHNPHDKVPAVWTAISRRLATSDAHGLARWSDSHTEAEVLDLLLMVAMDHAPEMFVALDDRVLVGQC